MFVRYGRCYGLLGFLLFLGFKVVVTGFKFCSWRVVNCGWFVVWTSLHLAHFTNGICTVFAVIIRYTFQATGRRKVSGSWLEYVQNVDTVLLRAWYVLLGGHLMVDVLKVN